MYGVTINRGGKKWFGFEQFEMPIFFYRWYSEISSWVEEFEGERKDLHPEMFCESSEYRMFSCMGSPGDCGLNPSTWVSEVRTSGQRSNNVKYLFWAQTPENLTQVEGTKASGIL